MCKTTSIEAHRHIYISMPYKFSNDRRGKKGSTTKCAVEWIKVSCIYHVGQQIPAVSTREHLKAIRWEAPLEIAEWPGTVSK